MWLLSLSIVVVVPFGVVVAASSAHYYGRFPWVEATYTSEHAKSPCGLIDTSVLRRYSDAPIAVADETAGDIHTCTASTNEDRSARSARITVSATLNPTDRRARAVYDRTKDLWTTDLTGGNSGDVSNLGQDAYFAVTDVSTRAECRIGTVDDNLLLEVDMRVATAPGAAREPTDIEEIRRISEDHARRAIRQLRS